MFIDLHFRNTVTFKDADSKSHSKIQRCSNAVMVSEWFETVLPTLLSNYMLRDFFNADKFSLFFQALHGKMLHRKGEKISEGKLSKVRLSGIAAANASGEKLLMFIMCTSDKP